MAGFEYYNITYEKADAGKQLVVKGEITNHAGRDYSSVAIRIILFNKNIPMVNTVVVVNGLQNGRTKSFDKRVDEIEYDAVIKQINRYEVYTENAY